MADSPRWCATCKGYGDHHTDRHEPKNPLFLLRDPATVCPVCFSNLRAGQGDALRGCPLGPHDERDYPPNGTAA